MAEAGQTAAVWCHDYVAVGCHDLEVPAVAPELAYGALRAAFAEEQGGVFLVWVEIGRENDPCEHVLAVGGLHPTLLYLAERKLGEDVVVFAGNLCNHGFLHILARGDDVDVGGRGISNRKGSDIPQCRIRQASFEPTCKGYNCYYKQLAREKSKNMRKEIGD